MEMRMKMPSRAMGLILIVPLLASGCSEMRARQAFKDGNKAYKEEDFKKAIVKYGDAVQLDPEMAEAWFYLGSAQNAMYRPGKTQPDNLSRLEEAIKAYQKSLEV